MTPVLLKSCRGQVDGRSPACSILHVLLQLFGFDVTPVEVGFYGVFVPFLWSALVSPATGEFSIEQASGHAVLLHTGNMPYPSELGLDEPGFNADRVCTLQHLSVGDAVLPSDSKYGAKRTHVEVFQLSDVSVV